MKRTTALPLLALALAACGPSPEATADLQPALPAPADPPLVTAKAIFSPLSDLGVSTGALVPPFSPDVHDYEVTSLTTLQPVLITPVGEDVTIDGAPARAGVAHPTKVAALDDATTIAIVARDPSGAPITYRIHTAPAARPRYTATSTNPSPGLIYASPFRNLTFATDPGWLYILDARGELAFYRELEHPAFDFKPHVLPSGAVRYTYMMWNGQARTYGQNPSTVYVLDEGFQPMRSFEVLPTHAHPAASADVHDVMLLGDDHWVAFAYVPETVTNVPNVATANVVGCVVQEVSGGQVVFDWDSTSVPELYGESSAVSTFDTTTYADYAHMNSVDVDPSNGNFLLSFRHLDELMELDRQSGAIVWKLGGKGDQFGLAPADKTSHQHYARFVGPNDILVFDNGNASQTTRLREYQIDPVARAASATMAYALDGHYTMAMGSVVRTGGRAFIGWGLRLSTDTDMTEVDPTTGEKSFELTFMDGWMSYRAPKL